jgi:hypothetical protein
MNTQSYYTRKKEKNTLKLVTQNIQKEIDNKIMKIKDILSYFEINIMITLEMERIEDKRKQIHTLLRNIQISYSLKEKKSKKINNLILVMIKKEKTEFTKKNS